MSAAALATVRSSYTLLTRVTSQLGEDVLAADVPVSSCTYEGDRTLAVPERVTLTVPRVADGRSWDATTDPTHPLATYGQRVVISAGVQLADTIEWIPRGEFLIRESSVDGDTVTVEAVSLLALVDEARFTTPFQPSGAFTKTIRKLVEPALTVRFATGLPTDRTVPTSMSWDEDRLAALGEVLDAWPADAYVDSEGVLQVIPAADPTVPVLTLTDGLGGTVVQWAGASSRDGACNLVVGRGQAADGTQVQAVAYDTDPLSPLRYGGPFNPLPVPYLYASPLLTTSAQCLAAARTVLARLRRGNGRLLTAQAVPHPGLTTGDLVAVVSSRLAVSTAVVERMSVPVHATGGAMSLTLRVVT